MGKAQLSLLCSQEPTAQSEVAPESVGARLWDLRMCHPLGRPLGFSSYTAPTGRWSTHPHLPRAFHSSVLNILVYPLALGKPEQWHSLQTVTTF